MHIPAIEKPGTTCHNRAMTPEERSYNMSRIRGKDTSIEKMLSRALWHRGLRFRKNSPSIYGHPDISIKKYRIAIFCDGDFWHGWNWEERKDSIKSNRDYWIPKIERNMQKDIEVNHALTAMGYTVIRVWEHEIRKNPDAAADMIIRTIDEAKARMRWKALSMTRPTAPSAEP